MNASSSQQPVPHGGDCRRCSGCGARLAADNTARLCSKCLRELRDQLRTPPADLKSEFFETPEFRAAFESRHIGKVVKAFRNHPRYLRLQSRALGQDVLGGWLGLNQSQVSKLETGKPELNLDILYSYAETLHLPQHLLWFDLPGSSRKVQEVEGIEKAVMEAASESARLLQWAESNSVGDLTLEQIAEEIRWISDSYLRVPTGPLFNRTRALRSHIFELLSQCRKPSKMMELYAAAGWCLSLLGWISTDVGASLAAKSHLRTAWACAENAERDDLRAWVRACEHTVHFWDGNYQSAARSARDGLRFANSGSSNLFLSSALALDLARAGDVSNSTATLEVAIRSAEVSLVGEDALGGPFACSVARATGFWSDVQLATGAAESSLRHSTDAVRLFESAHPEKRNFGSERMVRCQVVKAHLALGEIDGAEEALRPILLTDPESRVRPLLRRVSEISEMAAALPDSSDKRIAGIVDSIADFTTSSQITEIQARAKEIE